MGLPLPLTAFISEIFSSSGQPASLTPKTLAREGAVFFLQTRGAAVLALVVALDAVMRVIQRAGEVGSGICELEAFAMTPVIARKPQLHEAIGLGGVGGHQMVHVELVGRLEENARAVLRFALGSQRGPRGIERGETEGLSVIGLGFEPALDVIGEVQLVERPKQKRFEFGRDSETIDGCGFFGRVAGEGFALHESALDGIERGEFVMVRLGFAQFALDAEELADEVLKIRCQFDEEFRRRFGRQRGRIAASIAKPLVQGGRGFGELFEEQGVDFREARVLVEILKGEAKRQG